MVKRKTSWHGWKQVEHTMAGVPSRSWWLDRPRVGFSRLAEAEYPRMKQSRFHRLLMMTSND